MYPLQIPDVARALQILYGIKGKMQFSLGPTVQPVVLVGDASVEAQQSQVREAQAWCGFTAAAGEAGFFIFEAPTNPRRSLLIRSLAFQAAATVAIYWGNFTSLAFPGAQVFSAKYKDNGGLPITRVLTNDAINAFNAAEWMGQQVMRANQSQHMPLQTPIEVPSGGQFVVMASTPASELYVTVEFAEVQVTT